MMIRKASEDEKKSLIKALIGDKQDPEICHHRMVSNHPEIYEFEGSVAINVGKCLDCGEIILSTYRLDEVEVLKDKEWIEQFYEKRDDWRGYGWYEK